MPNDPIRTISRNSAPEHERVSPHGEAPKSSDTLANARGGPDADHHPEAAASTLADEEAGASGRDDDGGGIEPLKRR
ncbi:hypothetical protein GCM10011390_09270 [Aureimonas endophytica]|uniref:Uncharacterized protein n=1 Tax=Aureimonas endophytica TaxID=2027858 RepID=A0A917E0V2_9HYPH|nr:hypothetical protein [Aureimonas endophytica]GGD92682.1 hypothetical protein GCM10011390_09270 [Aureimonas endophytica]